MSLAPPAALGSDLVTCLSPLCPAWQKQLESTWKRSVTVGASILGLQAPATEALSELATVESENLDSGSTSTSCLLQPCGFAPIPFGPSYLLCRKEGDSNLTLIKESIVRIVHCHHCQILWYCIVLVASVWWGEDAQDLN